MPQLGVQVVGSNIGLRATLDESVAAANAWADATEAAGQRAGVGLTSGMAEADKATAALRVSLLSTADAANVFSSESMAASVRAAQSLELTGVAAQQAQIAYARLGMAASRYGAGTVGEAAAVARYTATVDALYTKQVAAADAAAAAQDRAALKFEGSVRTIGRSLTTYVSLPLAVAGYEAIKLSTTFQAAMTRIQTYAGASADEVNRMKDALLSNAGTMPQGPIQAAEALYHLESIGLRGAKALDALKAASLAAGAGEADLTDATTALGGAMVSNVQGAQSATEAMSYLVAIAGRGNMTMQDLSNALGTGLAAKASALGVSLREIGAAMDVMVDRGVPARRAATYLGATMALMSAPSKSAQDAITQMGISWEWMSHELNQPGGLIAVIDKLHERMQAMGRANFMPLLLEAFGRSRQSTGIQVLVTSLDGQTSTLNKKYAQLGQDQKKSLDRLVAYQQTASYKFHTGLSEIEADFIRLGQGVSPEVAGGFKDIANAITDIAQALSGLPEPAKRAFGVLALGAVAIGPLLLLYSTVLKISRAFSGMMAGTTGASAGMSELGNMTTASQARVAGLEGQIASLQTELEGLITSDTVASDGILGIGTAADTTNTEIGALQVRLASLQDQLAVATTEAETFGAALATGGAGGGIGLLGRAGMYGIGGLVAGQMAQSLIPGAAGHDIGRTLEFAGIGAGIGTMVAPEFGGTVIGGALGAGIGLVSTGMLDIIHSGPSFDQTIQGMNQSMQQLNGVAQRAAQAITTLHLQYMQLQDTARQQRQTVSADRRAVANTTPGTPANAAAVRQLEEAELQLQSTEQQLLKTMKQLNTQEDRHANAVARSRTEASKMATTLMALASNMKNANENVAHTTSILGGLIPVWHSESANANAASDSAQAYAASLEQMAQTASPHLAQVYNRIAQITLAMNHLPTRKDILIAIHATYTAAALDPARAELLRILGGTTQATGGKHSTGPALTSEQSIQVALAANPSDRQAITSQIAYDQRNIAELKRQRARGQIRNADFVTAVTAFYQDLHSMQSSLTSKTGGAPGSDTRLAKARLELENGNYQAAQTLLRQDQERLELLLKEATTSKERTSILRQLTEVKRVMNSKAASFTLSNKLQMEIARGDALAALQGGATAQTIALAKKAKAAAMKAIDNHTLTMQGLIDAWQIVQQENSVIAGATNQADLYHKVSTAAITDAVKGLTATQKLQLRERLAQQQAHRGYAPKDLGKPNAHGASVRSGAGGTTIMITGPLTFHGIQNVHQLKAELDSLARQKHSRAGGRR